MNYEFLFRTKWNAHCAQIKKSGNNNVFCKPPVFFLVVVVVVVFGCSLTICFSMFIYFLILFSFKNVRLCEYSNNSLHFFLLLRCSLTARVISHSLTRSLERRGTQWGTRKTGFFLNNNFFLCCCSCLLKKKFLGAKLNFPYVKIFFCFFCVFF